jgi:hypothetical protein
VPTTSVITGSLQTLNREACARFRPGVSLVDAAGTDRRVRTCTGAVPDQQLAPYLTAVSPDTTWPNAKHGGAES